MEHLELKETEAPKVQSGRGETADSRVCPARLAMLDPKVRLAKKENGDFQGHLVSKGKQGSASRDPRVT